MFFRLTQYSSNIAYNGLWFVQKGIAGLNFYQVTPSLFYELQLT
jgi:hypothetical protein